MVTVATTNISPPVSEAYRFDYERACALGLFDCDFVRTQMSSELTGYPLFVDLMENPDHQAIAPAAGFSPTDYLDLNPDLRAAGIHPYRHYLDAGIEEKRYGSWAKINSDANRILAMGLFDTEHYLGQQSEPLLDFAPAIHYLTLGWRAGLSPSHEFDHKMYVEMYSEALAHAGPPICYYADFGRANRHIINKKQVVRAAGMIAAGTFFDLEFYESQVGHAFFDRNTAIRHYIHYGYQQRHRPNPAFCDQTYAERNPDLWDQELPLACHFLTSGRGEGRHAVPFVSENSLYQGRKPFRRDCKTIIVICHEASLTGAPLLGLELVKQYSDTHNVISVLQQGGKIAEEFVEHSWFMLQLLDHATTLSNIIETYRNHTIIEACILNSVECAHFGAASTFHKIPTITLVHEYSEYVDLLRTIETVKYSHAIVFPAQSVKSSFVKRCEDQLSLSLSNLHVAHQGRLTARDPVEKVAGWTRTDVEQVLHLPAHGPRPKVVVGAGASQLRKGVDLFIQTAAFYRDNFGEDVRFCWVGSRKRSDKDIYEAMLDNMVENLGLQNIFRFIPHQPDLNTIFEVADIFYLSSRLDPFPNVFVDAVDAGLDCVAYEELTGAAEYIEAHLPRSRVVKGMDTPAAARAISEIKPNRDRSNSRLSAEREPLRFGHYIAKLNGIIGDAKSVVKLENEVTERLGKTCPVHYRFLTGEPDMGHLRASRTQEVARGLVVGGLRRECRLATDHKLNLNKADASKRSTDVTEIVDRVSKPSHGVLIVNPHLNKHGGFALPKIDKPIALHLHLYYWKVIHELLVSYKWAFDNPNVHFYISTGSESDRHSLMSLLTGRDNVDVRVVENRGRDIMPLLTTFRSKIQRGKYHLVGHLHGKKSLWVGGTVGDDWRRFCFDHLGGEAGVFPAIWEAFRNDPKLGLVFPEDPNVIGWTKNKAFARALMTRMNLSPDLPDNIRFPLGTMFWARPEVLAPFWKLKLGASDVPPEPLAEDGTILHAIERLMPTVSEATGHTWKTVHLENSRLR
jgi:glycosyltransferase involved in cell wall biosynthesis